MGHKCPYVDVVRPNPKLKPSKIKQEWPHKEGEHVPGPRQVNKGQGIGADNQL